MVWEGRPGWRGLAIGLFRLHWVAAYFAVLAIGLALHAGESPSEALPAAVASLLLGTACLAVLALLAAAVRRTTRYCITDRRIILTYGVALQGTLAIPYGAVAEVALRVNGRLQGPGGDISVRLKPGQSIGYVRLWPHARPWHLASPQPMLRALPDAAVVAAMLVRLTQAGVSRLATEAATRDTLEGADAHAPQGAVRSALPG